MAKYGTGATPPKGAKSSDGGGERSERLNNGVGMGRADGTKETGEFNTGRSERVAYTHKRRSSSH